MDDAAKNIESVIQGSEKLTDIFGRWPSFHDAEIIELRLLRGAVGSGYPSGDFPVLTLKIHVWDGTGEVDSEGFFVRKHHTLTNIRFFGLGEFQMEGFNHQNVIFELSIVHRKRSEVPSPYFAVEVWSSFGMGASFECLGVEVVDALPCNERGRAIA